MNVVDAQLPQPINEFYKSENAAKIYKITKWTQSFSMILCKSHMLLKTYAYMLNNLSHTAQTVSMHLKISSRTVCDNYNDLLSSAKNEP